MTYKIDRSSGTELSSCAELLKSRRTINFYLDEPVPAEILEAAIDVARWAPNHRLTQPWHFYHLGDSGKTRVVDLIANIKSEGQGNDAYAAVARKLSKIPGWLVVTSNLSDDPILQQEDYASCCCAIQNMMLYLWKAGVGVKWTSGKVTRDEQFFEILGINMNEKMIVGLFWYGYPDHVPSQDRKTVEEILIRLE